MTDRYTFLSWMRDGAAAGILQPETLATDLPARATLGVHLDVAAEPAPAPALYGRWYAGLDRPPADARPPHWLRELNLDPRLRTYAGLGAATVQHFQDTLMASAWEQLDQVEAANQTLRQAQLAREVCAGMLRRRIAALPPATLLQVTRPVHGRVAVGGSTLRATVVVSRAPQAVVTPPHAG